MVFLKCLLRLLHKLFRFLLLKLILKASLLIRIFPVSLLIINCYMNSPELLRVSAYGMDVKELCLVPNMVLPQKFKVPDLQKYKGLGYPRSHSTMYCRKMDSYIDNDALLIHWFQDNLYGALLD